MAFFESLQNSAVVDWLPGSESIWAYPTVLTLHRGLAALVGASTVLQLRLLGVGQWGVCCQKRKKPDDGSRGATFDLDG